MADVVSLRGEKVEADDGVHGLLNSLKELIGRIERQELKPEKWILLVESARPENPAIVSTASFDSGLTVSETVYMLDSAIFDIHLKVRHSVP